MLSFKVLIPARLGSSRLPNKLLADIAGLPMIVRVAEQAKKSQAQQVFVASDSPEVLNVCRSYGIECLLTRANHPSGSDRLAEACQILRLTDDELVVNVQGDEPLIDPDLINSVAQTLYKKNDCVMSTAAHPIHDVHDWHNPNVVKVVLDSENSALYFSRSLIPFDRDEQRISTQVNQVNLPLRHIGIYGFKVGFLKSFPQLAQAPIERLEALEQLRALWHGGKISVFISPNAAASGVDTAEDLERVRNILISKLSG
jgi:3-deoxy-manno-octulosonate cytidylyltransferase (CMP-KDO synthetase)